MRREYNLAVTINGRLLRRVLIDPHYEAKHRESVDDAVILDLVRDLDARVFLPEDRDPDGFEYYVRDPAYREGKPFRIVWVLHPDQDFIGVVNCFRRSRGQVSKRKKY